MRAWRDYGAIRHFSQLSISARKVFDDEKAWWYSVKMQTILPFAAVLLAIFAAGCIAYLAWEVTKEASREGESDDD